MKIFSKLKSYNLIADTNVWYNIAAEKLNPQKIKRFYKKLCVSPVSLLEIASAVYPYTFNRRREAAKAVLDHADLFLTDTEAILLDIWELERADFNIDWRNGFKTLANARSVEELSSGVYDFREKTIARLNISLANVWRNFHWEDFKLQIETAIDDYVPGYKLARSKGRAQHLNKAKAKIFTEAILSKECQERILLGTFQRALLCAGINLSSIPTIEQKERARVALDPYLKAYSNYLIKCATEYTPQHNDWGDLEIFIYLQGKNRLLTQDRRWIRIAQESCPGFIY